MSGKHYLFKLICDNSKTQTTDEITQSTAASGDLITCRFTNPRWNPPKLEKALTSLLWDQNSWFNFHVALTLISFLIIRSLIKIYIFVFVLKPPPPPKPPFCCCLFWFNSNFYINIQKINKLYINIFNKFPPPFSNINIWPIRIFY